MPDWYEENIEPGIRDVVRLLRDNGINTTGSCEHDMYVQADLYILDFDRVHRILTDNGYGDFRAQITMESVGSWPICRMDIRFPPYDSEPWS